MKNKYLKPNNIFLAILIINIIAFLIYAYYNSPKALVWLVQENNINIVGVDYYSHLAHSTLNEKLYSDIWSYEWGCFPPINYLFYDFMYHINNIFNSTTMLGIYKQNLYIFSFVFYSIITLLILYNAIILNAKKHNLELNLYYFSILFSPVLLGSAIFTGNSTLLVSGLILIFLSLKDHESKIIREIALIILALCAALKIYPAVFGLLYLKEKRYYEALRLTIYGLLFLFVPFVFYGGIDGFKAWISNILETMNVQLEGRIQYIKGLTYYIVTRFRTHGRLLDYSTKIMPIIFLITMIVMAIFSKDEYHIVFFLVCAMVFFPTNSFRYTLSYFLIPLTITFFNKKDKYLIQDYTRLILYAGVFAIPMLYGFISNFTMEFGYYSMTYVEVFVYSCAYILLIFEFIIELKNIFKKNNTN